MRKSLKRWMFVGGLVLFGACLNATSEAQDLKANDRQLTAIEGTFAQIEAAKTEANKDKLADSFESRLSAYAKAMLSSFDAALKQAETTAKSKGVNEGSFGQLKAFEDLAKGNEDKLKKLDDRGKKMKSGSILVPVEGIKVALGWLLGKIGDSIITPAHALIALQVYNTCHATPYNQTACLAAIAAGNTQRQTAQNAFNSCWNGLEGSRPKWWRAIQRGWCVTALVAKLA